MVDTRTGLNMEESYMSALALVGGPGRGGPRGDHHRGRPIHQDRVDGAIKTIFEIQLTLFHVLLVLSNFHFLGPYSCI